MPKPRLLPFRALHYNAARIGSLSELICPPYDVIPQEERIWLHSQHPLNAVRLEHPLADGAADDAALAGRAASTMHQWLSEGVLQTDSTPAIYAYRQRFSLGHERRERWGFFCMLGLADYARGEVLPHESTMSRPRSQRTTLLRICQAHFSPIMCIYLGDSGATDRLRQLCRGGPLLTAGADEHSVWVITEPSEIQEIVVRVAGPAMIADGHHRYEAALAYSKEVDTAADRAAASNYVLAVMIEAHDPGLMILPAHRLVKFGRGQRAALEAAIAEHCSCTPAASLAEVRRGIEDAATVAWFDRDRGFRLLTFKQPPQPSHLDALHHLLLAPALQDEDSGALAYLVGHENAVRAVERGECDAAVLVAPLPVSAVVRAASAGARFPKKATYFFPKLPAGLVMALTGPQQRVP